MASSGKKKTTMAKLNRENRQREKRAQKAMRTEARKRDGVMANSVIEDEPGTETEESWQLTRGIDQLES
jgi:hypothetical protein